MKKFVLSFVFIGFLVLSSCTPSRFFIINSEGILTYNRHSGQLEFMWQTKSAIIDRPCGTFWEFVLNYGEFVTFHRAGDQ